MEKVIGKGEVKVVREMVSLNMNAKANIVQVYFEDIMSVEGVVIGEPNQGSVSLPLSTVKQIPSAQDLLARIDVLISRNM